ncbi:type IV pilus twitching motility protein PilT [Luteolibacter pohnpeiensis]|nr:PilT/PilU family type 4a pilus ATPase [Luteolibacter pohnpeiensis]
MLERRAEKLVLVSEQTPFLLRGGEHVELSMPSLPDEMMRRLANEMREGDSADKGTYLASDGDLFGYRISEGNPGWRIEMFMAGNESLNPRQHQDSVKLQPAADEHDFEASRSTAPDPELLALLDHALLKNASDLFISSGKPPRIRLNGKIVALNESSPHAKQILDLLPDDEAHHELTKSGSVDFSASWKMPDGPHRIRINVFQHLDGVAAALRPIRRKIPLLSELSLPENLHQLATFSDGLVLVTGVAGSGKSTTLAALVDYLNRTRSKHIITIEDPVEYEHREIQCLIHQREVGRNVDSFAGGLRAALRESPDVILLGELRDLDTISAALTAAETGHLVLATLHAGGASTAVNRIVDVFPGHQQTHIRMQLSLSLRAVLSQRLLPSRTGGLVPAIEKLLVTPAVANGIREGHDHFMRNAMLAGTDSGMITLERSLATLVRDRLIDREVALRTAVDPQLLQHLLNS